MLYLKVTMPAVNSPSNQENFNQWRPSPEAAAPAPNSSETNSQPVPLRERVYNRKMGPPSGYGKATDQRPVIAGFVIIGLVLVITVIAGLWWQYKPQISLPQSTPTPTPEVTIPNLGNAPPLHTSTPLAEATLADFFKLPQYTITYNVVYNPNQVEPLDQVTTYTIHRNGDLFYLEAPLQEAGIMINQATGQVYTIEIKEQRIFVDHGALHTILGLYAIIGDNDLEQLLERGSESYRATVYRTEKYPGITAFFNQNELAYIRNNHTNVINQVVRYQNYCDETLFTLPNYPVYQIDYQAKQGEQQETSELGTPSEQPTP